jgi:hypothetical protein
VGLTAIHEASLAALHEHSRSDAMVRLVVPPPWPNVVLDAATLAWQRVSSLGATRELSAVEPPHDRLTAARRSGRRAPAPRMRAGSMQDVRHGQARARAAVTA